LLNDAPLRKRMGMKSRGVACEKWSPERVASETINAYRMALV
jgi:hypothetical protein